VGQLVLSSDGSDSKKFYQGWVGSGWVRHLWFGFGKFSLKKSNFSIFFPFGSKKISSDQVKKYPGQRRVCHLITNNQLVIHNQFCSLFYR